MRRFGAALHRPTVCSMWEWGLVYQGLEVVPVSELVVEYESELVSLLALSYLWGWELM